MKYLTLFYKLNKINESIIDDAIGALKSYTKEEMRWYDDDITEILLNEYPNTKTLTIYRGMNFWSEKEYNKFMDGIKDKTLDTTVVTSWSANKKIAHQFSVTKPTYNLNRELMSRESEKSKKREHMIGYRGIILQAEIQPQTGIDVSQTDVGIESEIILPPGSYKLEKIEIIKSFTELKDKIDPTKLIKSLRIEDFNKTSFNYKFFLFLLHNNMALEKAAISHLFKILYPKQLGDIKVTYDNYLDTQDIRINFNTNLLILTFYEFFNAAQKKKITKVCDTIISRIIEQFRNMDIDWEQATIRNANEMKIVGNFASASAKNELNDFMHFRLSNVAHKIQARVKEINKIKDPEKMRKEISKYSDDIKNLIQNIVNMSTTKS